MSSQPFINHANFNPDRLVKTQFETKTSKPKQDPQSGAMVTMQYHVCPIMYEYDLTDSEGKTCRSVAPLCIEAPELFSPSGILTKASMNGYDSSSIFTTFNLTDPEVASFVDFGHPGDPQAGIPKKEPGFWEKFYRASIQRLWEVRAGIQSLSRITSIGAMEGVFGYPIFFTRDGNSAVIAGKNPSKYFNLLSYGKPGSFTRKETLFTVPIEEKKIGDKTIYKSLDWKLLKNVEMKFKPLITFDNLFVVGGKVSAKFTITSAAVISIVKSNTQSSQNETLDNYASKTDIASNILAQVEALTRSFENSTVDITLPPPPTENKQNQSQQQSTYQGQAQNQGRNQLQLGYDSSQGQFTQNQPQGQFSQSQGQFTQNQPQGHFNQPQTPGHFNQPQTGIPGLRVSDLGAASGSGSMLRDALAAATQHASAPSQLQPHPQTHTG